MFLILQKLIFNATVSSSLLWSVHLSRNRNVLIRWVAYLLCVCLQGPLSTGVQGASLMVRRKPQSVCVHDSSVTREVTVMSLITPFFYFIFFSWRKNTKFNMFVSLCVSGHDRTPAGTSQCTGLCYAWPSRGQTAGKALFWAFWWHASLICRHSFL